jgi:hypothetical protein
MVILVILFVFILRKEIWPKKCMSKSFTEHVSVSTFNIPKCGKGVLICSLVYAVVSMKIISVEVASMRNSEVKRGAFR